MNLADLSSLRPIGADARADTRRPRLLLVCGSGTTASDALRQSLRGCGFVIGSCTMGGALEASLRQEWDALVIDVQADVHDAIEFTSSLRLQRLPYELPVLVIGAPAQSGAAADALGAGANDWVSSGVDVRELSVRLLNLVKLSRSHGMHAAERERTGQQLFARSDRLNALIETGIMMSTERDRAKLLKCLLEEGRRLLNCDGATMFMVTPEKMLRFELRTRSDALPSTQIPLFDAASGRPNENYVSVYTALNARSVLIDDVYAETRFDLSGTRAFDEASGYRTVSMLTVPIAPRGGAAIGVLQFMNAKDPLDGRIVAFDQEAVGLMEAVAAQAAVSLDNLALVESQKALMESMIRVLATAIDAKSHYTGKHCERVPELALQLAEAACAVDAGPLADFRFATEEEWQEFRIGAWLHDCGKVTTPEYVIDKATKLETLYNRIHEVRMRFEVLLRDLRIERLEGMHRGDWTEADEQAHGQRERELEQDFAFVARCNIGTEAMDEAHAERLAKIGAQPWIRHFDDRLGLSEVELAHCAGEPPVALPCVEPLLSDRPRHIVERPADEQLDPAFGFRMDVPVHLYNRGELYNLGVRRGTLTLEERYKINEHMVHTVMMLERMPFPAHLKRVPEYAGTHHERLDGRGYPRRLGAEALSVPSRIMAVADIFEALTAADRPYKKPKQLSEALRVMQGMAGPHIDRDVFNLFLSSGVFLAFAHRHLQPEQIDVSDPSAFLAP